MQYTLIGLEIHTGPILLQGMDCGGGFFAFLMTVNCSIWWLQVSSGGSYGLALCCFLGSLMNSTSYFIHQSLLLHTVLYS